MSRLRDERLARSTRPFIARGSRAPRCPECRVISSYCLCEWRPSVAADSGICLLMYDTEPLKPTNTGWLIADVIQDTHAFLWSRIEVDEQLLALLDDPQWQPYIVFPGEFVAEERVVNRVSRLDGKRPLFILLDATWTEARKMFRKSPYLKLAGDASASGVLDAYLDVFSAHYLGAKYQNPIDPDDAAHTHLKAFI
ncbi:hypothetical protein AO354_00330 [Pseudomonas syringae pv. syringae]|nr:hypothetical protein AO354_00330 [Pseudomonas syringae pv. syringae]